MGIQLELTLDHDTLGALLSLQMVGKRAIKIANTPSNKEAINKRLAEIFQTNFVLNYDEQKKKWILKSESYSILEKIRRVLPNHDKSSFNILNEIELHIKLNTDELEKLSKYISKIHRVIIMDYSTTNENKPGFVISKFSSLRYVNALVALPDVPLISIIRFSSRDKASVNELYDFHIDKLTPFIDKEDVQSFWLNNYLKSRRTEKNPVKESNDEFQRIILDPDTVVRALVSSLRGVVTTSGILLPWPFSSFELASASHKLYTLFLADVKIVDDPKPCRNTNTLGSILDQEIKEINYLGGQELSQNLVKLEGEVYLNGLEKTKRKKMDIILVTLRSVVYAADLRRGKRILGFLLGQAFRPILREPVLLIHACDGKKIIEFVNEINSEFLKLDNIFKNPLSYDAVFNIARLIYKLSYKDNQSLGKLSGNLELLDFVRQTLSEIRTVYKKALNDELEGEMTFAVGQELI